MISFLTKAHSYMTRPIKVSLYHVLALLVVFGIFRNRLFPDNSSLITDLKKQAQEHRAEAKAYFDQGLKHQEYAVAALSKIEDIYLSIDTISLQHETNITNIISRPNNPARYAKSEREFWARYKRGDYTSFGK